MITTTAATFHPCSATLACDLCGCVVDSSDRGRAIHQAWHNQTAEVIDLTVERETTPAKAVA